MIGLSSMLSIGAPGATAHAQNDKLLTIGNGAEPDTLDPHKSTGTWESTIVGDMMMGLMTEDIMGNAIYGSAISHEASPDGFVYTFKMRPGLVWSDGVPVTSHDFVFAMRRILNPATASQYASLLYVIKKCSAG